MTPKSRAATRALSSALVEAGLDRDDFDRIAQAVESLCRALMEETGAYALKLAHTAQHNLESKP